MIKTSMKKPSKICSTNEQKAVNTKSIDKKQHCCCSSPTKSGDSKKTTIRVKYDCGFPNTLYVRGEGLSSLSWDKGKPMKNVSNSEWIWECNRPGSKIQFKILLNDEIYETGDNHMISYGEEITLSPVF